MRRTVRVLLLVMLASAAGGCATLRRIANDPGDVDAKQVKRTAETVEAFETQRNFAQFQAAQARWREGNTKACREALDSLLVREPTHLEARLLLVQVLLSEEKYDLARGYLEQILAERPADARAQHTMGLLLESQDKTADALEYYRKAAELEPETEQYAMSCAALADAPASMPAARRSSNDKAIAEDEDPPADGPSSSAPRFAPHVERVLADAERALEKGDTTKARDLLTKAVSLDPDSPRLPIRAAVLALRHKYPELAVFVLQPLAQRYNDSAAFHCTLGTAHYRLGNYQAAQRALEQALSLDNTSGLAYLLMGCTLEKLGQTEAAKTHLEQAGRLNPRLRAQL
jgi:tetratricopeptide (TPR) repeat protein